MLYEPKGRAGEYGRLAVNKKYGLPLERHPNWKGGRTVTSHGYVLVKRPEHPGANSQGYVYEHRLIAEEMLGRLLEPGELVHHLNGNRTDNRPENLEVEHSITEHKVVHRGPDSRLRVPGETNPVISCECGCGRVFSKYDTLGRPRRYAKGCSWRKGKKGYVSHL